MRNQDLRISRIENGYLLTLAWDEIDEDKRLRYTSKQFSFPEWNDLLEYLKNNTI